MWVACRLGEYLTVTLKPSNSLGHGPDLDHCIRRAMAPMAFAVVRLKVSTSAL